MPRCSTRGAGQNDSCVDVSRLYAAMSGKHAAMDYGQDVAVLGEVDGLTGGQTVSDGQHVLKFEIQLYKVRDNEYVVDFQVRLIPPHHKRVASGLDVAVAVQGLLILLPDRAAQRHYLLLNSQQRAGLKKAKGLTVDCRHRRDCRGSCSCS